MSTFSTVRSRHRYWGYLLRGIVALAILFFLAQTAYQNFDTFFNRQLRDPGAFTAFDGGTTAAAKSMDRLGPDYRILTSSLFFSPALQFIYPPDRRSGKIALDPTRDLPLGESRPTALYLDDSKEPYVHWIRALYPNAVVRETTDGDEHIVL